MKVLVKINNQSAKEKIEKKDNPFSMKKNVLNIELVYLSYYLFKSEIKIKHETIIQHICVDCLSGEHAFIKMKKIESTEISDEKIDKDLSETKAMTIAKKVIHESLLLEKGKGITIDKILVTCQGIIKYPYWIGYYNRKTGVDFEVIDAVNGKKQGAKMKPVFIRLIMQ